MANRMYVNCTTTSYLHDERDNRLWVTHNGLAVYLIHIAYHVKQAVSYPAPDLQYYLIYDQQEVSDTN